MAIIGVVLSVQGQLNGDFLSCHEALRVLITLRTIYYLKPKIIVKIKLNDTRNSINKIEIFSDENMSLKINERTFVDLVAPILHRN